MNGSPPVIGEVRRVLFLSHSHAYGAFRVGSHHYARELARAGADVVHLSTPISRIHRLLGRVTAEEESPVPRGPHADADGVSHLVPRTTLPLPVGRFSVARELRRYGIDPAFDAVLIDQPLLWDSAVRALAPRLVYRPTDLYPSGVKNRLQRTIRDVADGVVATSEVVLRELGGFSQPRRVIGNGVDVAHFTQGTPERGGRPPVCVYAGALDSRFDWQQLSAWALAHPEVKFVVAGPSPQPTAPLSENIELVGSIAYDALPALLHDARVGLLPLSDDPLNAGRSPMKLHEYLAAGLAVVARGTSVIRSDSAAGMFTYDNEVDAGTALTRALGSASPNAGGVRVAANESWQMKAGELAAFLNALPAR
ncbi:glycosyltransferase [Microbacterium sp. USHLN186]|uniref:glycosyltransferase n=1 Tax=Microbacterium sp. USHLN186 TaxID=3081286 RepID=UPI0030194DD2